MLTLPRFFALAVAVLAALAALALTLGVRSAGQAILSTGQATRADVAARVAMNVESDLMVAEKAVSDFERAVVERAVDDRDVESVRRNLLTEAIARPTLTDLTMTMGVFQRYDEEGTMVVASEGRRQLAVSRESDGRLDVRVVADAAPGSPDDPTLHPTFRTAANEALKGKAIWSDLAFSELDAALPEAKRRKTMTVQKAIWVKDGAKDRFVGVLRAGIVSDALDHVGERPAAGPEAAGRMFICDDVGRLVTRLDPADPYELVDEHGAPDEDGDLRVRPRSLPADVAAALAIAKEGRMGASRIVVAGAPTFVTVRPLAEGRAQMWRVGLVMPESAYVGPLVAARDRLLMLLAAVVVAIAALGLVGARTVGRGMSALVASTEAMRRFSFAPSARGARSPFAEVRGALESVERAKTALRAMVKYVPVGLVRRLYESGVDPTLGAELHDVTLMFTDIEGFTSHAESLPPARLAEALGRYLEAATAAVEATGGTVDKYIGDALMVMWNAPAPVESHAAAACHAALACARATAEVGASAWWRGAGLPPWRTRFGLHTGRVLVGHFGAPDRLSYTAMGDGVNLAARLEGLNKSYGTTILASEDVRAAAGDAFTFRLVDRVAVKGKSRGVAVYELLGLAADPAVAAAAARLAPHGRALEAAWARRFAEAVALVDGLDDGPSRVLAARCRAWTAAPPPADWDGTWVATSK
ncbi:MAG TPA: adenylate/guanylate cyclase domain-containing protein [Polyangia bacterium]|nr:adenylate/guanylate cyclase domain-containing protein [Polyangia bacterium]